MDKILHDLIYLNYGIYGTILYLGHAGILSINSIERLGASKAKALGQPQTRFGASG